MLSSSNNMSNNSSYSNDRSSFDTEYAVEASAGSFFHSDFKKHEDLKEMLDSNKDSLKLEAMKRIIGMIAKGRDASMLFPAVVKNVVSKNIEVKKLVYVYLERYAEEQQDLALLSISTFQRALKEPNQLIRAGALRVLSSIRVKMISPIIMLAIKDASSDMSPYVRKTAAHAIPKLYSIDNELKSELIAIIQKLLADKTVLVIGSAVMAFTEVCPERIDLIHQVFRKLCALIADVDEWGQVTILNMLTRYARTQFADPNLHEGEDEPDRPFYDSNSDTSDKPAPSLDPDHRLLLRSTRPLLLSRNAAVVMAVAQLYYHAAPKTEYPITAKALIRLLRSHVEVQSVVLSSIASITIKNKNMFEPHLRSFFVLTSDPTNIKLLKLEILTNLTTDSNVSIILRELQTYISSSDKYFVAATIQAIGRCACTIPEVTDSCLNGLVSLLSNRDEAVVAESVVVIKRLLQTQAADPKEIITHMARLLDSITVAQARAAILWLLGEHSQKVPLIAPDVLRKMAITFGEEDDIVKLQIMNLSIKLYITNYEQTSRLCQYIFNLARYDQNYDIRDKARLFKHLIHSKSRISSQAATIFLTSKPAPLSISLYREPQSWQLGSLSHYIKLRAVGYEDLPPFPEIPPPGDVRNVEPIIDEDHMKSYKQDKKKDMFSWESEQSSGTNSSSESASSSDSSDSESDSSEEEDEDDDDENDDEEEEEEEEEQDPEEDEEEEDDEDSSSQEESSEEHPDNKKCELSSTSATEMAKEDGDKMISSSSPPSSVCAEQQQQQQQNEFDIRKTIIQLEDFFDIDPNDPIFQMPAMKPLIKCFNQDDGEKIESSSPPNTQEKPMELLNRSDGKGLSIDYEYIRKDHMSGLRFTSINLIFTNHLNENIENIHMGKRYLINRQDLLEFTTIENLAPNSTVSNIIAIDFDNSIQPVNFEIKSSLGSFRVSLKPVVTELMRPIPMLEEMFLEEQEDLRKQHELTANSNKCVTDVVEKMLKETNLGFCYDTENTYRFAGMTRTKDSIILVTIQTLSDGTKIIINCENTEFAELLINHLINML